MGAIAVVYGIIVRMSLYFANRSLWTDELFLAMNIRHRSYIELLSTLDYNQAAPPLFLCIERFAVQVFGENELSLRFFPLLAGIAALFLIYRLAFLMLPGLAALLSISLFAVLRYTVYFSNELKPYSIDLFVSLILFSLLWGARKEVFDWPKTILISLVGSLCIWVSYPAVFTLLAAEITVLFENPVSKYKQLFKSRFTAYACWIVSFIGMYWLSVAGALDNSSLVDSWSVRYPSSIFDLFWLLDAMGRFFYRPLGFQGVTEVLAMLAFVVGCAALWHRNRLLLVSLLSPFIVTLAAAFVHKYPFRDRLILYLVPYALFILSSGIAWMLDIKKRPRYCQVFGLVLLFLLGATPAWRSLAIINNPHQYTVHHLRPLIAYVDENHSNDDLIYIFPRAQIAFDYYTDNHPNLKGNAIRSRTKIEPDDVNQRQMVVDELLQVRGNSRVWLLGTDLDIEDGDLDIVLQDIDLIGTQLDIKQLSDAVAVLYDFSLAPASISVTEAEY